LKLTFDDDGIGEVRCSYVIRPEYQGYPGLAHGGIVAAILDEVVGRVAIIGDPNHFMMTVRMAITYRQPVPLDTPLTIVGRPVNMGGRLARAVGEVRLPDGSLAVEAELTLVDVPERMRAASALDALGWKVYP
jgi:uncharacterized protein (TIGR00369 family)